MLLAHCELQNGRAVQFRYVTPRVVLLVKSESFQNDRVPLSTTNAISQRGLLALLFLLFIGSVHHITDISRSADEKCYSPDTIRGHVWQVLEKMFSYGRVVLLVRPFQETVLL